MNDPRYPFHARRYLGPLELDLRLPREEEDFSSLAEAREWLRETNGGTVEKHDPKTGWTLIASVLAEDSGGSAFVA